MNKYSTLSLVLATLALLLNLILFVLKPWDRSTVSCSELRIIDEKGQVVAVFGQRGVIHCSEVRITDDRMLPVASLGYNRGYRGGDFEIKDSSGATVIRLYAKQEGGPAVRFLMQGKEYSCVCVPVGIPVEKALAETLKDPQVDKAIEKLKELLPLLLPLLK